MAGMNCLTSIGHTVTRLILPLFLASIVLAACAGASVETAVPTGGSCTLGVVGDDATQLAALLQAEGELVVSQQIDALMALWAESGEVVDAKHTPDDPDDDQRWMGLDAVRHRYVRIVFPGNPAPAPAGAAAPDYAISVEGESAVVRATTRIGDEVAPAGDRWAFRRSGECWFIESLTYNLEATSPP